jgi:hypothetical protein
MRSAGRSLVLVPSGKAEKKIAEEVRKHLNFKVLTSSDIEQSKQAFTSIPQAVAIVANRYDGIDFPGDDCRLLFLEGLPKATNLQELFIMSRMGANALYNDRVLTRLVQAIGRCTRSLTDYSAVVATGEDLTGDLLDPRKRSFMHPELQAELAFGIEQSSKTTAQDIVENFAIFLEHKKAWEEANEEIVRTRQNCVQQPLPALTELASTVAIEIDYQTRLWAGDFEGAMDNAESVLGQLTHASLRGYRALWEYLAGSAASLGERAGSKALGPKCRAHFMRAYEAASFVPWLIKLGRVAPELKADQQDRGKLYKQIERTEMELTRLGTIHDRAYGHEEAEILAGLLAPQPTPAAVRAFEQAQVLLGWLLGFVAGKIEEDASPDPWWMVDETLCFVFESYSGAQPTTALDAEKARQAITHPNWIRKNLPVDENASVLPILVSPVTTATAGAEPHLEHLYYWGLDAFREWAKTALRVVRELRRTFVEPGSPDWRNEAATAFELNRIGSQQLMDWLGGQVATRHLKVSSAKK